MSALLINALPVNAGLWDSQTGMNTNPGGIGEAFGYTNAPKSLQTTIGEIIKIFLGLLGVIFMILIVLAGYKWMTALGSEEQVSKAKSQLKSSVIGLMIVVMSYALTVLVLRSVFEATI